MLRVSCYKQLVYSLIIQLPEDDQRGKDYDKLRLRLSWLLTPH